MASCTDEDSGEDEAEAEANKVGLDSFFLPCGILDDFDDVKASDVAAVPEEVEETVEVAFKTGQVLPPPGFYSPNDCSLTPKPSLTSRLHLYQQRTTPFEIENASWNQSLGSTPAGASDKADLPGSRCGLDSDSKLSWDRIAVSSTDKYDLNDFRLFSGSAETIGGAPLLPIPTLHVSQQQQNQQPSQDNVPPHTPPKLSASPRKSIEEQAMEVPQISTADILPDADCTSDKLEKRDKLERHTLTKSMTPSPPPGFTLQTPESPPWLSHHQSKSVVSSFPPLPFSSSSSETRSPVQTTKSSFKSHQRRPTDKLQSHEVRRVTPRDNIRGKVEVHRRGASTSASSGGKRNSIRTPVKQRPRVSTRASSTAGHKLTSSMPLQRGVMVESASPLMGRKNLPLSSRWHMSSRVSLDGKPQDETVSTTTAATGVSSIVNSPVVSPRNAIASNNRSSAMAKAKCSKAAEKRRRRKAVSAEGKLQQQQLRLQKRDGAREEGRLQDESPAHHLNLHQAQHAPDVEEWHEVGSSRRGEAQDPGERSSEAPKRCPANWSSSNQPTRSVNGPDAGAWREDTDVTGRDGRQVCAVQRTRRKQVASAINSVNSVSSNTNSTREQSVKTPKRKQKQNRRSPKIYSRSATGADSQGKSVEATGRQEQQHQEAQREQNSTPSLSPLRTRANTFDLCGTSPVQGEDEETSLGGVQRSRERTRSESSLCPTYSSSSASFHKHSKRGGGGRKHRWKTREGPGLDAETGGYKTKMYGKAAGWEQWTNSSAGNRGGGWSAHKRKDGYAGARISRTEENSSSSSIRGTLHSFFAHSCRVSPEVVQFLSRANHCILVFLTKAGKHMASSLFYFSKRMLIIALECIGSTLYAFILLHKLALQEVMQNQVGLFCYTFSSSYPSLAYFVQSYWSYPRWTPQLVWMFIVISFCSRPCGANNVSRDIVRRLQAARRDQEAALLLKRIAKGGKDGAKARKEATRLSIEVQQFHRHRQYDDDYEYSDVVTDQNSGGADVTYNYSNGDIVVNGGLSILGLLRLVVVLLFLAESFTSSQEGFVMGLSGSEQVLLGFMLAVVKMGYAISPVIWISWSIQVLLLTAWSSSFVLEHILLVLGLASLRLVACLAMSNGLILETTEGAGWKWNF